MGNQIRHLFQDDWRDGRATQVNQTGDAAH
jgi:hypothetical protein